MAQFGDALPTLPARDVDWLRTFKLLNAAAGVDFTFYKKSTIKRRIARRMALHKLEHLTAYVKYLESHREEVDALYQDILIHVTSFFREPDVFRTLQNKILPRIYSGKPAGDPFRVWIAGCSTGEEAYSFAICLVEVLAGRAATIPVQVFGTDVSEEALEKARAGIYPKDALSRVSPGRLRRFFNKVDGHYQIKSNVRDLCVFARHDLTKDPPFSRLDLISCRNVLIYLEPVLQKRILASFHYGLKDTGYLLLGKSETLGGFPDLFSVADRKSKFFTKKSASRAGYEMNTAALGRLIPREKQHIEEPPNFDLEKETDRIVWDHYAHAGLVVNNDLQILYFRGDTSPYLRPAAGKATFHLLRMLRDELVFVLRAGIHKARRTGEAVRPEAIRVKHNGSARDVTVEVRPLPGPGPNERYFLILFDETSRSEEPPPEGRTRTRAENREVLRLKTELARTKEYLQSVIQEQESTNEELKTANEEALSSMEELQSANEELETAKEELQSSNEELVTLNEQLQNRNTELAHLTDDLTNVLGGLNIPVLMLDADRRIRRATPSAERLLHLLPGDIGRPLSDIRMRISTPDLDDLISRVMEDGRDVQREVKAEGGQWFSVRLCPYRTRERAITGVLIAFIDTSELRQSQEAIRKEENLVSAILDDAAKDLLVVVMNREGRIVRFNRACQERIGYSLDEVTGRRIWDFLLTPKEAAGVRAARDEVRVGKPIRREDYWITKDGGRRLIAWSSSIVQSDGVLEYIVATGTDVTERQQATENARDQAATVKALLETASQAVLAHDRTGRIKLANAAAETMFGYTREELLALPINSLLPQAQRGANARRRTDWLASPWTSEAGAGLELTGRRKDASAFPVAISVSHLETKDGPLGVTFVLDVSERKKAEAALLKNQQELQRLTARLLSIQETETQLIARDLHDDLSQKLAALGMEAYALAKFPPKPPDSLNNRMGDFGKKISALADDVHRLSRRLHPAILDDLGLEAALREECLGFAQSDGIPVEFHAQDVPRTVPADVALCLFRVGQEALRNIGKHAGAEQVHCVLACHESDLVLTIEDAGAGFKPEEARRQGGLGLISMEERVRLVNGEFFVRSQPGKGTEIEVHVPLKSGGS